MEYKDYYKILGVPRDASEDDIKKAFRKLARQHHPDVAKDKKSAEEKFKSINEAYEVLGHPENRKKYDQLGANWKHGAEFRPPPGWQQRGGASRGGGDFEFHFGGTGFSDFFEQLFGRGSRFGGMGDDPRVASFFEQAAEQRGADVEGDIMVTLEEVMNGSVRTVSLQTTEPRTGASQTHSFKVRIPAGVREDQLIRVAGKGEAGMGGVAGDLYLRVRFAAHPEFRVRGVDLYHDLELAPWEAVLGTTVSVPTLDGPVSLRVPPGTNNGQQLRLRGRGLPASGAERGHLFAVIMVRVPTELSAEERELWEKLARTSRFSPRD